MQTLAPLPQQAGQQPANLCGPYWVALWLRSRQYDIMLEQVAQQAMVRRFHLQRCNLPLRRCLQRGAKKWEKGRSLRLGVISRV